jgi:uncharacterized protein involved in response to NO
MLFGFAAAALAGFLLTAVPNWTSGERVRGPTLLLLITLWLAGRIAAWAPLSPASFAAVDLLFLPALATAIAPDLLRSDSRRNIIIPLLLAALTAINLAFHTEAAGMARVEAGWSARAAIDIFVLMIAIIGGRIVPAFTMSGMRSARRSVSIAHPLPVQAAAIGATALMLIADLWSAPPTLSGALAALAALAHLVRLGGWRGWTTLAVPLVAILHVGYLWLPIGFALRAVADLLDAAPASAAAHAFTAGAIGTMILAVMTRATRGHTGRPLVADGTTVAAYALVVGGALLRVAAAIAPGGWQGPATALAGLLWSGGFALFVVAYGSMLVLRRPDAGAG